MPKPTRCSVSRSSTSATETLKVFLTRSLILRTTLRLPLRLALPGRRRSTRQVPMTMGLVLRYQLLRDLLADEWLDNIAPLHVGEALEPNPAFIATTDFMHILLEAAQRGDASLIHDDVIP